MAANDLLHKITRPSADLFAIADKVAGEPGLLPAVFAGLGADKAKMLDLCLQHVRDRKRVLAFVERQQRNRRPAVRRKATAFLKKRGWLRG